MTDFSCEIKNIIQLNWRAMRKANAADVSNHVMEIQICKHVVRRLFYLWL